MFLHYVLRPFLLMGLLGLVVSPPAAAQRGASSAQLFNPDALRVFVCGSASPLGNVADRAQACIAVIAGRRMFVVDTGSRSAESFRAAGLPIQRLEAVLLTHFHDDHIADLARLNQISWMGVRSEPLTVIGPEGVERVVNGFNEAYALNRSYRTAHHGEELLPARTGPMQSRAIEPGVVLDEDGLVITAFAVDHQPIEPAFGYRFDFAGRSVVVSGDTVATQSLAEAAQDADLLLHDAMSLAMLQQRESALRSAGNQRMAKIFQDVQDYHASTGDVVELARKAGVGTIALYHLIPTPLNDRMLKQFMSGMPEDVIVTKDGMLFELAKDAETVEHRQLF